MTGTPHPLQVMKKKGLETWLYSSLGVAAMFLIVVIANALADAVQYRLDPRVRA